MTENDCPIGLGQPHCPTCIFIKDGRCNYPYGLTPGGGLFTFEPRVTCEQVYGEHTTKLVDEIEAGR